MKNLIQFNQLRSAGIIATPEVAPYGHNGIVLGEDGICTVSSPGPGLWNNPTVLRSELASDPLPRYGVWTMHAEFMIPALWPQDSVCFWYSATNDAGESKQYALSVIITGDLFKICTHTEAEPGYHEACRVSIVAGQWYRFDLFANLTPGTDGFCVASLNDKKIAAWDGPTWWDDKVPPFYGFGVYGGWNGSDPLLMQVREFSVT